MKRLFEYTKKLQTYIPSVDGKPYITIVNGDGLSCECENDAHRAPNFKKKCYFCKIFMIFMIVHQTVVYCARSKIFLICDKSNLVFRKT